VSGSSLSEKTLLADRLLRPVRVCLRMAGLLILTVLIATPALQVFMRQFLGMPMVGAEELSRFMLISVVMITVPYTISSGASVRMEEFLNVLPDRIQWLVRLAISLLGFAAFCLASWSVLVATLNNLNNETPTLGIPYFIFFSATAVGFFFAAIEFALLTWKVAMGLPPYVQFAAEQPAEELTL
jgi:TRAP-type C4-dicarboxylate transport system permease small subunit